MSRISKAIRTDTTQRRDAQTNVFVWGAKCKKYTNVRIGVLCEDMTMQVHYDRLENNDEGIIFLNLPSGTIGARVKAVRSPHVIWLLVQHITC